MESSPEPLDCPPPPNSLAKHRPGGKAAIREVLVLWAVAFAAIALTRAIGPISGYAKAVAAVAFLYLPGMVIWRRNEDFRDYGATLNRWKQGVKLGLLVGAIVLPLFIAGYFGFLELVYRMPQHVTDMLSPYPRGAYLLLRLPDRFLAHVVDQFLVVALPEELFYRGFLQARLRDAWPQGRTWRGAKFGKAFWATQVLFALGHLTEPYPWRLGVFFPSLLFGWLREKSGTIVPGTILHALSNLTVLILEASLFSRR